MEFPIFLWETVWLLQAKTPFSTGSAHDASACYGDLAIPSTGC
jgi:hypothetical protein